MIKIKSINKLKKEKSVPIMKLGTHKKIVVTLWGVLIVSILFSVYKNFTAIDVHTIHEKEVIRQEIIDTNSIENFVKDFARSYYSWQNTKESIADRTTAINQYLIKELQELNKDMIRADIPTNSTVRDVQIWEIESIDNNIFEVTYSVTQDIKENENIKQVKSNYLVKVYKDDKSLIIIQNPTLTGTLGISSYEPKVQEADVSIDSSVIKDATVFLETFFKLYPTATEKELSYYMKGNVLPEINANYLYSELINPIFYKDGDNLKVSVSVKYLDQQTKAIQISQYALTLHKDGNWNILE